MPTAKHGEDRILIMAPPLRVYELVSDVLRIGEWSPECGRTEWLDGATAAHVGARFRGYNKLGWYRWQTRCRITAAEPGRLFTFVVEHDNGREETRWSYRLYPVADGGGTELIESFEFVWCPLANRIAELPIPRDRQVLRGIKETLQRIKATAERAPSQDHEGATP